MAGSKPFLSVYGHVTIDQILSVNRFPELNESVDVTSKKTTLGGTGTNISVVAARLGIPTAICAFVGEDFPSRYEKEIKGSGVITDELIRVEDYETSQAIVINNPEREQKVIFYQGPQGHAMELDHPLIESAKASEYIHFCTGQPEYYIMLMEMIGPKKGIAVDPAQEVYKMWDGDKMRKALAPASFMFCNNFEAKVIERYLCIDDVMTLDKELIVRTDGGDGSVAKIKGEMVKIPMIPGKVYKDATGAGDAYRAGFYAGLYNGYDLHDSLILASATSSFVVEKVGALTNIPTWDMVTERAEKYM